MDREDISTTVAGIGAFLVTLLVLAAVGWATSWFGLVAQRPMMKYAEDTRRQVFEHSQAHIDGTNEGINDYCLNMREAGDPASKEAFAKYINGAAANYDGPMTSDVQACVGEAKAVING